MKMSDEEIKKLADSIKLNLSEEEIEEISGSIHEITSKLDELLKVETNSEPKIMGNEDVVNVFSDNENEIDVDVNILKNLNNYDGKYITTRKVVNDEE